MTVSRIGRIQGGPNCEWSREPVGGEHIFGICQDYVIAWFHFLVSDEEL